MPDRTLTGLAFEELASRLGSRTRALAARRWLFAVRPVPSALPDRIPGVSIAAWAAVRSETPMPSWRIAGAPRGARRHDQACARPLRRDRGDGAHPGRGRSTVCVSSQAGCTRHCRFCATATLGFARQLAAGRDRAAVPGGARGGAGRGAGRATWCSWGWASRWTTSTRCWPAVDRLTDEARAPARGDQRDGLDVGRPAGMERFLRECRGAPRAVAERDDRRAARAADATQPRSGPSRRSWTRCARTTRAARAAATSSSTCSGRA